MAVSENGTARLATSTRSTADRRCRADEPPKDEAHGSVTGDGADGAVACGAVLAT